MSREEALKICLIVQSTYPTHYAKFGDRERAAMLEAWLAVMADYDFHTACGGLKAYMANDTKGFPPSPGQIIDQIYKLTASDEERLTESEAWGMVYKALRNGVYGAEKEFGKLPPAVQRAVGTPEVLRQWAQDENVSVTQSNFERVFRRSKEEYIENKKTPESVKQLIGGIVESLRITEVSE